MAMIGPGAICAICKNDLPADPSAQVITTFHVFGRTPWDRYSDCGMHRLCFVDWADRESFLDAYNSALEENGSHWRMLENGEHQRL